MSYMFLNAYSFNQPLNSFNTSRVTDVTQMFSGANSFNQDISGWSVRQVKLTSSIFEYNALNDCNKEKIHRSWVTEQGNDRTWEYNRVSASLSTVPATVAAMCFYSAF